MNTPNNTSNKEDNTLNDEFKKPKRKVRLSTLTQTKERENPKSTKKEKSKSEREKEESEQKFEERMNKLLKSHFSNKNSNSKQKDSLDWKILFVFYLNIFCFIRKSYEIPQL